MEQPTTLRGEIRKILADSKDPLTRIEIFGRCKFAGDQATLSTVLSQLCVAGDIKKVGELESAKGRALALYAIAGGGAAKAKKERKPRAVAAAPKKRGPHKKRAKPGHAVVPHRPRPHEPNAPGFRCGIFSDGSLDLEHAGDVFQMTQAEVRVLLAYIEKVLPEARP